MNINKSGAVIFNKHIQIKDPDTCWNWPRATTRKGYGVTTVGGRTVYAHRVSYSIHIGTIPPGKLVCHRCDNRKCVNPSHLFLGSAKDNTQDMILKGRCNPPTGERAYRAKLSEEHVICIRSQYSSGFYSFKDLALLFSVSVPTIKGIIYRYAWRHI